MWPDTKAGCLLPKLRTLAAEEFATPGRWSQAGAVPEGFCSLLWVWAIRRGQKLGRAGWALSHLTEALQTALLQFYYGYQFRFFSPFGGLINF